MEKIVYLVYNPLMNFWESLQKPIMILAPMDGVTDTAFRQIITSTGRPGVFFTEFVPVDALLSPGKQRALRTLKYTEVERPIVAQIWGSDPEKFYEAAKIIVKLGFDGIDINMGCPDKSAIKKGACSALINNPKLAQEIIKATIKGAGKLPVSVKTRIGFKKIATEEWITTLLQTPISALTIHLRTASEMSKPPAHWDQMPKIIELRNKINPKILIIGNGDVKSVVEAKDKCKEYGIDGVMIGRGIFENLYLFDESVDYLKITSQEKIKLLIKHLKLYDKAYKGDRPFELMKKFVKCYINNFNGATEARERLMRAQDMAELIKQAKSL